MYDANSEGGHRAKLYGLTMRDEVSTRLQRERDLHGAVARGEFVLHYQPEFDLASRNVVGMEALLRWQHPHCGLLPPGEFIEPAQLPPELSAPPSVPGEQHQITLTPGTTVDDAEMKLIEITLAHTGQNKTRAAEMLGISLKTLHNKLNRMKGRDQSGD